MTNLTLPRALAADAAAFLAEIGGGQPDDTFHDPVKAAEFLRSERSRLGVTVGADVLDEFARAVATQDHEPSVGLIARSYTPPGGEEGKPVVLYIHGGGWVSGGIEQHDSTCRILAVEADAVVFNVDYRMAPEHVYPAALDDCQAALDWVLGGGLDDQRLDLSRLAVCGSSSGGNLAAALAVRSRSRPGLPLAMQVLIYPALDSTMMGKSYRANGNGYFVSAAQMAWYWRQYRGENTYADRDPLFSPLVSDDLAGLPPAVIVTAEFDVLRDDGARYADRLAVHQVPVRRIHYPGQIHGFMGLLASSCEAYPAVRAVGALVGSSLRRGTGSWLKRHGG